MNEAITKGSVARNIVAELLHCKRLALRLLKEAHADNDKGLFVVHRIFSLEASYAEAHNAAETARRILYGIEL